MALANADLSIRDYLTPGEVAKLYGVTARTVSNWCDQGRIPHVTTPSGHRRIPAKALLGADSASVS